MDDAFESIGLQVELNYTKALGQVSAFEAEVQRRLSGSANDLNAMAGALNNSLNGFKDLQRNLRELHTQFSVVAADIRTATQDMSKAARATGELGDEVEKLSGKEARAARERRKNAEYENKSLQQKMEIYRKLSNFMDGRSLESLNKAERKVLGNAYSQQALTDYANGTLAGMRNNSEQARLERWFLESAKRSEEQALEYGRRMATARKAGAAIVSSGEGVAAAARKAEQSEQARLEQWFLNAAAASEASGRDFGKRLAASRKAGAAIVKQGEGVAAAALKANQQEEARLQQWFLDAATRMEREGVAFGTRMRRSFRAGAKNTSSILSEVMAERAERTPSAAGAANSSASDYAARQRREALRRERDEVFRNRDAYREMHSAARGIAGGSGLLWLTYGAMLPMALGAGAVAGGSAMMSKGADFTENMAFVKALSEDTTPSLQQLQREIDQTSQKLLEMGERGRFSAIELSASMRTLAQAGYNSKQASQMLPSVTNLSTIGETTPDKAALTIAGTLSAFNMDAGQSDRVANVIGAAAAASQTSVEQMMESMKQASSVAQDYGSSLEETASVLTLLAKRNITGSSAGTAFRNMMVDLAGRTKKATATLQELGIELYDNTTGRARETKDVLLDLLKVMDSLNQRERNTYLKRFADERGLKALAAVIGTGPVGFNDVLSKMQASGDNGGFAARMANELNQTTKAEGLKVLNTLTSQLIQGFLEAEDSVKGFLRSAQQAAGGAELRDMVRELAKGTIALGNGLVTLLPVLGPVTKAFIAFGTVKVAASGVMMLSASLGAMRAQLAAIPLQAAGATLGLQAVTGAAVNSGRAAAVAGASWRVFWTLATGPIGLAVGTAVTAWALFGDSAEEAAQRAKKAMEGLNADQFASEATEAYKRVKEGIDNAFASKTSDGPFKQTSEKSLQDVIENTRKGSAALTEMQETAASGDTTRMQSLLDTSNSYYQQQMEAAEKFNSGSAEDAKALTDFFAELARVRYDNEAAAMDLMVIRSKETAIQMMQDAANVGTQWQDVWAGISQMMKNSGNILLGQGIEMTTIEAFKKSKADRGDAQMNQQVLNLANKVNNAAMTGLTVDNNELMQLKAQLAYNTKLNTETRAMVQIAVGAAGRTIRDDISKSFNNRATSALGVKLNSNKPSEPGRSNNRVPNDDYIAAKMGADLAKQDLKLLQDQLALRKSLGQYVSEALYAQEDALKQEASYQEYLAQKEQIERNIAKAKKAGNEGAARAGQDQLTLLERQYQQESKLQGVRGSAEAFLRAQETASRSLNAELELQTALLSESRGLMRNASQETIAGWRARQQELTIQKAQLDLQKELDQLDPAAKADRQLRIDAARLKLAQQLYDINRRNFEANSRDTATMSGYIADFYTELQYQLNDMRKTGDSIPRAMAKGLVAGTESAFNKWFQYIKDPQGYRDNNGGEGYGGRQFLAETLSGVYDQMAAAMSKQATENMTASLMDSFKQMTGFLDPMEEAQRQAQVLQEQDNALKEQLIQSLGALNTTLSGGQSAGMQRELGGQDASASNFQQAGKQAASANDILTQYKNNTLSLGDAVSQVSVKALSGFSMMHMGLMSLMTGTKQGIKDFVAFTIAELLRLWLVQKLVGMVSAGVTASAGSGLSNGGVDIGSPDYVPSYVGRATGGQVLGPGTSTSDSIPVRLSNREYVISAGAVDHYGVAMFDMLNAKKLATGGPVGSATLNPGGYRGGSFSLGGGASQLEMTLKLESDGKQSTNDLMSQINPRQLQSMIVGAVRQQMLEEFRQGGMMRAGGKR